MKSLLIQEVADDSGAQAALLLDDEGPDFAVYQVKRDWNIYTRKPFSTVIMDPKRDHSGILQHWNFVQEWDGLFVFTANVSGKTLAQQLKDIFKCQVIWQ